MTVVCIMTTWISMWRNEQVLRKQRPPCHSVQTASVPSAEGSWRNGQASPYHITKYITHHLKMRQWNMLQTICTKWIEQCHSCVKEWPSAVYVVTTIVINALKWTTNIFRALSLMAGWHEGHPACENFCFKYNVAMVINVSGQSIICSIQWAIPPTCFRKKGIKSFSLSCEDASDKDDWRLRIKRDLSQKPAQSQRMQKQLQGMN